MQVTIASFHLLFVVKYHFTHLTHRASVRAHTHTHTHCENVCELIFHSTVSLVSLSLCDTIQMHCRCFFSPWHEWVYSITGRDRQTETEREGEGCGQQCTRKTNEQHPTTKKKQLYFAERERGRGVLWAIDWSNISWSYSDTCQMNVLRSDDVIQWSQVTKFICGDTFVWIQFFT